MKYIICDVAPADWGKSTTLVEVAKLFKSNSSLYTILDSKQINNVDEWLVIRVNATGKIIIIQTEGDLASSFAMTESFLQKMKHADIIICASRTKGRSYQEVQRISNTYNYKRIEFSNFCPLNRSLFSNQAISMINKNDLASIIVNLSISL